MKTNLLKTSINKNGQALVEFAIILIPLCLLTFGMIEFGRYLYLKNTVTNAAREAARTAVVSSSAVYTSNINGAVYNFFPSTTPGLSIVPIPLNAPASGLPVKVTVRIPFTSVVPDLLPIFKTLTSIRATATMRYE